MNPSDLVLRDFINAVGDMRERMVVLAASMRSRHDLHLLRTGLDIRNYQSGAVVECHISAETSQRTAVSWWIDIFMHPDHWVVESSVRMNREEQEELLVPELRVEVLDQSDLPVAIQAAVDRLVIEAETLDLSQL